MIRLAATPAIERLEWILDGLDRADGWNADVEECVAPSFLTVVPDYADRIRRRSDDYVPVEVVAVESSGHTAKARIRNHGGDIDVLACTVEADPPHRITMTWMSGLVPAHLTPGLPADFSSYELPQGNGQLIVFAGVPGSGKSTLADAVGRELHIPVFAADWLLGALTPFGGYHHEDPLGMATEQLTTLALRQLSLGQSAILDAPVEDQRTRDRWCSLAARAGADFRAIVCVCPDQTEHRRRVETRTRGIPGWHDAGNWDNVCRRLDSFPRWDQALVVDTNQSHDANVRAVIDTVTA